MKNEKEARILVIDDEPSVRSLLKDFFSLFPSLRVSTAENGEEGIDKIKKTKPDVVVTDVDMPVKNGIEVARHVLERGDGIHIIIMSGGHVNEKLESFISTRKLPFLRKPINLAKLKEIVSGLVFAE